MFMNRIGAVFEYEGTKFTVGQPVVGTDQSAYEGLYGFITEIRDGEDKETENDTPDIYCTFEPPVLPHDIVELEKSFSRLYQEPKKLEDIGLNEVIMAPEMIKGTGNPEECRMFLSIHAVIEDWAANGERGHSEELYTEPADAKYRLHTKLKKELEEGCLEHWQGNEDFRVDSAKDSYEGYLDGEYDESHYAIRIEEKKMAVSEEFINSVYQIIGRHIR